MCTGYLSKQIEEVFHQGQHFGATIEYSEETVALGTAGALKFAQRYMQHEREFLVLNGDSFLQIDFGALLAVHRKHGSLTTMAVVHVENASRYGTVHSGTDGRITNFAEKTGENTPGLINAGVYVFNSAVLGQIPDGPASLERDVFPMLLEQGIYVFEQHGMFIDIGIPEDYARAGKLCDHLADAAMYKRDRGSSTTV
jgi:NDP-sugar pyrophosphorylase family protein